MPPKKEKNNQIRNKGKKTVLALIKCWLESEIQKY